LKPRFFLFFVIIIISCTSVDKGESVEDQYTAGAYTVRLLSYYLPSLLNSPGDTHVYVMDSGFPGASMLLVGGTHANETAGIRAAELFIEHARVEKGCVFVIPHLNGGAMETESRLVPLHLQGMPDADYYIPPRGETIYTGAEQRNINRSYPGSLDMGLSQLIALAVMELLILENIDIAIDMHEARPSSDLAWKIVANQKNMDIAIMAIFDLEDEGIVMGLEISPPFDGFSHREWGNRTGALAFLTETANPAQENNPALISGYVGNYRYDLEWRVYVQLKIVEAIVNRANEVLAMPLLFSVHE